MNNGNFETYFYSLMLSDGLFRNVVIGDINTALTCNSFDDT